MTWDICVAMYLADKYESPKMIPVCTANNELLDSKKVDSWMRKEITKNYLLL